MMTTTQVIDRIEQAIKINRQACSLCRAGEGDRIRQLNDQWVLLEQEKHNLLGTDFAPYRMVQRA